MKREERKRKFNEAIVNILYPSSPQRDPSRPLLEQELEPVEALIQGSGCDAFSGNFGECENASTSGDDGEHDSGTEKLTRAQRKKIRKKKLKEVAIRRGKLMGPLLPPTMHCGHQIPEDPPPVRSNASEKVSGAESADEPPKHGLPDEPAHATLKKRKNRRMMKRLAKEKRIPSTSDTSFATSSVDPKVARA